MENNLDLEVAKNVLRVRLAQMIINEKYKEGLFKIPIHLALGHEAIAVAVDKIMGENDQLVLSHRNIHYNLARTKLVSPQLNEYLLKKEGLAEGKLGSMNLINIKKNIVYASSILGNNLSVSTGLALSKKILGKDGIVIVETGDGAIEEGSFYESLLFLKSNQLSSLIIVENNEWSLATSITERRCNIDLQKFAASLEIKHEKLRGNDVYKYIEAMKNFKEDSLKDKSPTLIEVEIKTLGGRWVEDGDPSKVRFINYHAGPATEIKLSDQPEIENSSKDPIFVLKNNFDEKVFFEMSQQVFGSLKEEVK